MNINVEQHATCEDNVRLLGRTGAIALLPKTHIASKTRLLLAAVGLCVNAISD